MENIRILLRAIGSEEMRLAGQSYWLGWYKKSLEVARENGLETSIIYYQNRYDETQVAKLQTERAITEYNRLIEESLTLLEEELNGKI